MPLKPKSYEPWHQMRAWCVDAARTAQGLDKVGGPKSFGNNWPIYIPDYPTGLKSRFRPTPKQISRMEAFMDLVNTTLNEEDRKTVYSYGMLKISRNISRFLKEIDENTGNYNRMLAVVFTKLLEKATIRDKMVPDEVVALVPVLANKGASSREKRSPTNTGYVHSDHPDNRTEEQRQNERKRLERRLRRVRERNKSAA